VLDVDEIVVATDTLSFDDYLALPHLRPTLLDLLEQLVFDDAVDFAEELRHQGVGVGRLDVRGHPAGRRHRRPAGARLPH
jgi:hypothetical protein